MAASMAEGAGSKERQSDEMGDVTNKVEKTTLEDAQGSRKPKGSATSLPDQSPNKCDEPREIKVDETLSPPPETRKRKWSGSEQNETDQNPSVQQFQEQAQETSQRSAQASKQMVYDIFGFTVGSIEILEMYHDQERWNAQDIRLSPESAKMLANWKEGTEELTLEGILAHVNIFLRLMYIQMTSCHQDIREGLKSEFTTEIEEWLNSCMEVEFEVMNQVKKQLQKALKGEEPEQVRPQSTSPQHNGSGCEQSRTPNVFSRIFGYIMRGFQRTDDIDMKFREHPEMMAKRPKLRDRHR